MAESGELAASLAKLVGEAVGRHDVTVDSLRRLAGGSSRENWAFEASSVAGGFTRRPLLLRRDPPTSVAETNRADEVAVVRALAVAPIPAPVVLAVDLDAAHMGRPSVVMERAPGRADRSVLRARDPLELGVDGQASLARDLCDLLADLHRLDPDAIGLGDLAGGRPADPALAEIERWEGAVATGAVGPQPELAYVACWLRERRPPPPARQTLVHGDFRPANVLVDGGAVGTLLDWEFAHLGDPAEDVGWYTTPIYRNEHFGEQTGWITEDFLARYQQRAGTGAVDATDPARLRFWQVLALFKLGAIAVAAVESFLRDGSDRASDPTDRVLGLAVAATLESV